MTVRGARGAAQRDDPAGQPQRARAGAAHRGTALALGARRAHRADPQRHPPARRRAGRRRPRRRGARASRSGTPGRPSPLVRLDPERAVVLALEIAVDSLAVAVVGLGGQVLELVRVDRPRGHVTPSTTSSPTSSSSPTASAVRWRHARRSSGSASPSSASSAATTASCRRRPTSAGATSPLGRRPRRGACAPAPIVVANEADLGALAEHRRGAAAGTDDVIFLSGEVGLGGGLIVGGRPLTGVAGYGGEVGHMPGQPAVGRDVPVRLGRLLGDRGRRGGAARARRPARRRRQRRRSRRSSPTPPPATPRRSPPLARSVGGWGSGSPGSSTCSTRRASCSAGASPVLHPFIADDRRGRARPAGARRAARARRDRAGDASASTPRCSARPSWRSSRSSTDPASWFRTAPASAPAGPHRSPTRGGTTNMSRRLADPIGYAARNRGRRPACTLRRSAALIMSAALVLAACGDDDDDGERQRDRPTAAGAAPTAAAGTDAGSRTGGAPDRGGGGDCVVGVSWNNYQEERWAKWDEPAHQGGHRGRRRHLHLERRQVVGRDAGQQRREPDLPGRQRARHPRPGRHGHQAVGGERDRAAACRSSPTTA